MFDILNMCVNEARIVTCIVNHTKIDRETLNYLQDYLGVVGGVWRVLCFRNGREIFSYICLQTRPKHPFRTAHL